MQNKNTKIYQNFQNIIKKLYCEESGSAIILALIIIAGLAGTGLGAARLAKSNTQQASIYENSLKAYYAAEAGIESALLEWRFDHNVEFWDQDMALKCFEDGDEEACNAATVKKYVLLQGEEDANVEDISDRFDEYGELKEGYNTPRGQGWYEMEISYRNPRYPYRGNIIADPSKIDDSTFPDIIQSEEDLIKIEKDQSMEISFPKEDEVRHMQIYWNAELTKTGLNCGVGGTEMCQSRLIVHPVALDENGEEVIIPIGERYVSDDKYFSDDISNIFDPLNNKYWVDIDSSDYVGITAIRLKCQSTSIDDSCYLGIKTTKGASNGSELVFVPQDLVQIKITGHYGDVERTLEYKIDRKSGTILDIFDHGVYSRETFRK